MTPLAKRLHGEAPAQRLRLVLGDQLNSQHSWYKQQDNQCLYVVAELHDEARYVAHHVQKVVAFFYAMAKFAESLRAQGHRVLALTLDDTAGLGLAELLETLVVALGTRFVDYQRPDEFRLLRQLSQLELSGVTVQEWDTEHFYLPFEEIAQQFPPRKSFRMEAFYRRMRRRFAVLMDGDQPEGGQWNFDQQNRSAFNQQAIDELPAPRLFKRKDEAILQRLSEHKIPVIGELHTHRLWPATPAEAWQLLDDFCNESLANFGTYQDAMTIASAHGWLGYHSRLSFALNTKLLQPAAVIDRVIACYRTHPNIAITQVEGFVRQILGWREFIRVLYWANMPAYSEQNALAATRALPGWYWTGATKMNCMAQAIGQSLRFAYAHHIQRLMITGNFALLAGIDPQAVDHWYLGIYADAIEWVELPNTRGMALFADGGWLASKPYAASGQYIGRMSDYCRQCRYRVKQKTGPDACPFNSLYWHFLARHQPQLQKNSRLALAYRNWQRFSEDQQAAILEHGEWVLTNLEAL